MKKRMFYVLMLIICFSQLPAQTTNVTLTQKQVMNFEVGDVFHYTKGRSSPSWSLYNLYKRTILSKSYNQDSSSVTYEAEEVVYEKAQANANWLYERTDTITLVYHQLNNLCVNYFTVLLDSSFYCPSTIPLASYSLPVEQPDNAWGQLSSVSTEFNNWSHIKLVAGLGAVSYSISGSLCSRFEDLLWCKKGNQTFGTPDTILSDSNIVMPNLLKRKEAFNFDVGDIFQFDSTYTKLAMSGDIEEKHLIEYTILAKDIINNTWIYTVAKKDSMSIASPPTITYTQSTITLTYNNLEDWVSNPQNTVNELDSVCAPTRKCVEEYETANFSQKNTFYEGMGSYSLYQTKNSPVMETRSTHLLYAYKAATNQSCGTRYMYSSATNITDITPVTTQVFVELSNQTLTLTSPVCISTKTLSIFDTNGRMVYQTEVDAAQTKTLVPIVLLSNTLYFIALDFDNTHWRQKMVLVD